MELEELKKIQNLTELDLIYKIVDIAQSQKKDSERILKGNKIAGKRVREAMQDIRFIAEVIRNKIQETKGLEKGPKRKNKLELAIQKEEERIREEDAKLADIISGQKGE